MVGEEIQKLSVIQSIPNLLVADYKGCIQKIFPKINQGLMQGSTEYHMTASAAVQSIVQQKLIPPDQFAQNFLHTILNCIDLKDPEVSKAWFETLLEVMTVLPVSVILREILPVAIIKSEMSKTVIQRQRSCKMLGRIARCCDAYVLKKEVFPIVQALTQDTSKDVRATMCAELPLCAAVLTSSMDKDILPILNELANDEQSVVKVAAFQTIVDVFPFVSQDSLKNVIVPLCRKMIDLALNSADDDLKVAVTKNLDKICNAFEKVILPADKMWLVERFTRLAQLGLPQMKLKDRLVQKPGQVQHRSPQMSSIYLECRLNCALYLPTVMVFSSDINNSFSNSIYPVICDLSSDPYFMVRRSVGAGINEITKLLGRDNNLIMNDFFKLLKDDAEEVLQGVVPNIKAVMECFCETKTLSPELVDEPTLELARALLKCESEIAGTYDWRLYSQFLQQIEVLPKCFPSDFIFSQFVTLLFKRLFSCRAVPCRVATVRTLLVFLRYNLKPSQRTEIRNKIINDLCSSRNSYDRVIFLKSCPNIIDIFSSVYFREFFFAKTIQLTDDKVPNVRLLAYSLIPQIKTIAKLAEKTTPKFSQMVDLIMKNSSAEKDRDVKEMIAHVNLKLEKLNFVANKVDPKDAQKLDEEKHLATMTGGKEWKSPSLGPTGAGTGPLGGGGRGGGGGGMGQMSSTSSFPGVGEKRSPLSASYSRVNGAIRTGSTMTAVSDQPKLVRSSTGSLGSSPARSPSSLSPNLPSNRISSAVDSMSHISWSTSPLSVSQLTSRSNGNLNKDNDVVMDNSVIINNDGDSNNNYCTQNDENNLPSDNSQPPNVSATTNTVLLTEKSLKIPVMRYQSPSSTKKLNTNLAWLKTRRHSSFCHTSDKQEGVTADDVKGKESVARQINLSSLLNYNDKECVNGNNNVNKKRSVLNRRPRSMTAFSSSTTTPCPISLASMTCVTKTSCHAATGATGFLVSNKSDVNSNNLISRLPIRSGYRLSAPPKRT